MGWYSQTTIFDDRDREELDLRYRGATEGHFYSRYDGGREVIYYDEMRKEKYYEPTTKNKRYGR